MTKQLQQKIKEAEAELEYFENILGQIRKGIKVEGFEDVAPAVIDQLIARQKRIIENLRDGKTEILKSNNMSKIHITKAKVLNEKVEVEYYQVEKDLSKTETSQVHNSPPHDDLTTVFDGLAVHAALANEFIPSEEIGDIEAPDHEGLQKFKVKGFSIIGDEEDQSVIISAMKELSNGKMFGFNTVKIRLADTSDKAYQFAEQLGKVVKDCMNEVREYLNGKHGPKKQTEIDFPAGEENGGMKAVKGGKGKSKKKATAEVEE